MHIRTIALLLLLPPFVACRQETEKAPTSEANAGFQTLAVSQNFSEVFPPLAMNIVFQSTDGGQTWQDVSAGLPAGFEGWNVFSGAGEVFIGDENNLYRGSAGATAPNWSKELALDGRINKIKPGRSGLYASSFGLGLYQNMPGSDIWRDLSKNLENKRIYSIFETVDAAIILGCDNGIFKSADGGKSWKKVYEGGFILDIVASDGVLMAGGEPGVLRSTDNGEHWDVVFDENILIKKTSLLNDRFAIVLGTKDPDKINPNGITSRLRVSADGGKTWQRMEQPLMPVPGVYDMDERLSETKDIYDIVQVGEFLFCSFDTGIFRSADQGKTWEPVLISPKNKVFSMAVSGNVIYAIPRGGGC